MARYFQEKESNIIDNVREQIHNEFGIVPTAYCYDGLQFRKNDITDIVKARAKTAKGDTELKSRYGFNPMEAMELKNLPKYAQEGAYNEYHRLHGIPEKGVAGYNYEELIFYGKYLKERGPRESGK